MKKVVGIIDNYDSFTYNLVQLVEQAGTTNYFLVKNDALDTLHPEDFDKMLISPGPGLANEAGQLMPFLKQYHSKKSFLGICLGCEAIGALFGARLLALPQPLHGYRNRGFITNKTKIFEGIPDHLFIGHYHSWSFDKKTFPSDLLIDMKDEKGRIMAFHHRYWDLTGVLFHPESMMTEYGGKMIRNWLQEDLF